MGWEFMCRIGVAGEDVIRKEVGRDRAFTPHVSLHGSHLQPPKRSKRVTGQDESHEVRSM